MIDNKNPFVSVIICAYSTKRLSRTIDCIKSLLENDYKKLEIIVVIDGNEELKQKIKSIFRNAGNIVTTGHGKDEGPSMARNRGVEISNGDIIAFIDDDAIAQTDWLSRIVQDFSGNQNIMVIGGKLLPVYNNVYRKLPEELLWIVGCTYKGHAENKQIVRNVISANMAVKRDIFNEVTFESIHNNKNRLFTPIKQLEDTLFCINVNNKMTDAILYDPDIIVYHSVPVERLKLSYIIKRTFSEGMLKAQLKNNNKADALSQEQNYLCVLLNSITKNLCALRIRNSLLLWITVTSVVTGYMTEMISSAIEKIKSNKI